MRESDQQTVLRDGRVILPHVHLAEPGTPGFIGPPDEALRNAAYAEQAKFHLKKARDDLQNLPHGYDKALQDCLDAINRALPP